nr:NAD(P)-dependent oxidoreductase [uncultured Cohaesibacter sp.]
MINHTPLKVLLTGATGFVGSHVLSELLCRDAIVTATYRGERPPSEDCERLLWIQLDLEQRNLKHLQPQDTIIHLAWGGLPNYRASHHILVEYERQRAFLKSILEFGIKNIFVAGTCFEYGQVEGKLSETMPLSPHTEYGGAKVKLFQTLLEWQKESSFNLTWGRLFYLFGKGQGERSLYSQLQMAIESKNTQFDMSAGAQERDFLPIEKAAWLIVELALRNQNLGAVNICSGKPISVKAIVEEWVNEAKTQIALNLGVYPYPDYEVMRFWGDGQKLQNILEER